MTSKTILVLVVTTILIIGTLYVDQFAFAQNEKESSEGTKIVKTLQIQTINTDNEPVQATCEIKRNGRTINVIETDTNGIAQTNLDPRTLSAVITCDDGFSSIITKTKTSPGTTSVIMEFLTPIQKLFADIQELFALVLGLQLKDEEIIATHDADVLDLQNQIDTIRSETTEHIMRFDSGSDPIVVSEGQYINNGRIFTTAGGERDFQQGASLVGTDGTITHFRYHIGQGGSDGTIVNAKVFLNGDAVTECTVTSSVGSSQSCTTDVSIPVNEGDLIAVGDVNTFRPEGASNNVQSRHASLTITTPGALTLDLTELQNQINTLESEITALQIDCTRRDPYVNLSNCDLSGRDFINTDFRFADFSNANLQNTYLREVNFSGADLSGANLIGADLGAANLTDTTLTDVIIDCTDLRPGSALMGCNYEGQNLTNLDLTLVKLMNSNLILTNLSGSDIVAADLSNADLSKATLTGADLTNINLTDANFGCPENCANLSFTNLLGANLSGANLSSADLIDARLLHANLSGANLSGANLSGADLREANLSNANLSSANLTNADFNGARAQPTGEIDCIGTPIGATFTCTGSALNIITSSATSTDSSFTVIPSSSTLVE